MFEGDAAPGRHEVSASPKVRSTAQEAAGEGVRGGGPFCGIKAGLRPTLITSHKQHFVKKGLFLQNSGNFQVTRQFFKPPIISS